MEVSEAPMLAFGDDGRAVSGMIAWGQRCVSAIVKSHWVLALVEERTSHVSWLFHVRGKKHEKCVM